VLTRQTESHWKRFKCTRCKRQDLPLGTQGKNVWGEWRLPERGECAFCLASAQSVENLEEPPKTRLAYASGIAGLLAACRFWNMLRPFPVVSYEDACYVLENLVQKANHKRDTHRREFFLDWNP
jgi:hypothetical protein